MEEGRKDFEGTRRLEGMPGRDTRGEKCGRESVKRRAAVGKREKCCGESQREVRGSFREI